MCQIFSKVGYIASQCFQLRDLLLGKGGSSLIALVVEISEEYQDVKKGWALDSGATYHLTRDMSKARDVIPFKGYEQVTVDNSPKLSIHNIGIDTIDCCDQALLLKNIVHSLQTSSNLLFVNKLCVGL